MSEPERDLDNAPSSKSGEGKDQRSVSASTRAAGLTSLMLASAVAFGVDVHVPDKPSSGTLTQAEPQDLDAAALHSAMRKLVQSPASQVSTRYSRPSGSTRSSEPSSPSGPPPWDNWQNFQNWQNY